MFIKTNGILQTINHSFDSLNTFIFSQDPYQHTVAKQ